jgi:hypothetical protein
MVPETLRVAQIRVVRKKWFNQVVRRQKFDRKLIGLRLLAQMSPSVPRFPHILSRVGETSRPGQLVPFHQEVPQLMRDREPGAPVAFRVVGKNAASAAHGVGEQYAFEPIIKVQPHFHNIKCNGNVVNRDSATRLAH